MTEKAGERNVSPHSAVSEQLRLWFPPFLWFWESCPLDNVPLLRCLMAARLRQNQKERKKGEADSMRYTLLAKNNLFPQSDR